MSTKIITADLDAIAYEALRDGDGQPSPLYRSEAPEVIDALAAFEAKIKAAYIAHWAGRGIQVVHCPDADFMDKVASGQIDADNIYEATTEEEEASFLAAWEDAGIDIVELTAVELAAEAAVQQS